MYQTAANDPLAGQALEVRLSSTGFETFFDNVRLIAVNSLDEIGVTSDLDRDGQITPADWSLFLANSYTDLSGYSPAQQFLRGDIDRDGDNDYEDFKLFKFDYIAANGAAAFEALFAVPEPSAASALLIGVGIAAWRRTRHRRIA